MVVLRKRVEGLTEPVLMRFVARAKRAIRLRGRIDMLVTDSRQLMALNRRFRGKDRATDVLSFPASAVAGRGVAGDIAIAADIARQNAGRLGHTAMEEIKILALHGMLHLAGYDHERDHGEMARAERRLRKWLRLPLGLIERNGERSSRQRQPRRKKAGRESSAQWRSGRRIARARRPSP